MRLQSLEVEKKPKIMIIPMIDIIFFLLVFFMITSDGQIYVEQEKIDHSSLRKRMEIEKNRNPEVSIVLRADEKSEHGDFVFVLDQLKSVGISKIGIATEAKPATVKE